MPKTYEVIKMVIKSRLYILPFFPINTEYHCAPGSVLDAENTGVGVRRATERVFSSQEKVFSGRAQEREEGKLKIWF